MEALIGRVAAILIGIVATGAVIYYVVTAYATNHLSTATAEASQMFTKAQSIYDSGTQAVNFSTVSNQTAISARIVPSAMVGADGNIRGPWRNSSVTLSGSSDGNDFIETWTGVPADSCSQFAMSQKPVSITVNGTTIAANDNNIAGSVAAACSSETNTVAFTYGS